MSSGGARDASPPPTFERYCWAIFWAALLTGFVQSLLVDTPVFPYRRVAFAVAFIAFAALIVSAVIRRVRGRRLRH